MHTQFGLKYTVCIEIWYLTQRPLVICATGSNVFHQSDELERKNCENVKQKNVLSFKKKPHKFIHFKEKYNFFFQPGNILIQNENWIKLCDLGIVAEIEALTEVMLSICCFYTLEDLMSRSIIAALSNDEACDQICGYKCNTSFEKTKRCVGFCVTVKSVDALYSL